MQFRAVETCPAHIGTAEISPGELSPAQVSLAEIGSHESDAHELGRRKLASTQVKIGLARCDLPIPLKDSFFSPLEQVKGLVLVHPPSHLAG